MFHRHLYLILFSAVALSVAADAQVVIKKPGSEKSSMDFSGLTGAGDEASRTFRQVLESDLIRSGYFAKAQPGAGEFALKGSSDLRGNTLRAEVTAVGRATQQTYLNKAYSVDAAAARRMAHQVADEIVFAITGKKGFASARLALVGNRSGKKELYLADSDGKGLIQLTRDNSVSIGPVWSPDGKQLLYTSYLKGFPDIYLIDIASGGRKRIANYPGLNTGAAMSPDGRSVAMILSKDGNPDLYVKNLSSGNLTRLTDTRKAGEASPSWSPDGSEICYVSDSSGQPQLYVVSRNGGQPRRLTSRGYQNVAPDWGQNGLICYASLLGGRWTIHVMDPKTLEDKQITPADADYEDPSWAPDGRHIACGRSVRYASKIYLLDIKGDPPLALTDYPADWYSPAWSPSK
jgi:TolB protein